MGTISYPQLGKSWHHMPTNDMTYRDYRREGPVYGSRHGENSCNLHFREDVDLIKSDYTHHWHLENIAKLDGFPTSPSSDSPSNCWILCTEKSDHQTSHPMKIKHRNNYLRQAEKFWYLPISSGQRYVLFVGEMLEEQVSKSTWMIADLVDQLTKSVNLLN